MSKKNWLIVAAISLIIVLGYRLRMANLSSVPLPGQSTDEYSNAWVGLSLIRLGFPVGISGLSGIKTYPTYINPERIFSSAVPGGALPISYPWFDHPPAMGLISGGVAYLRGEKVFEEVTLSVIRRPVVLLSTLSIGLVFLLGTLWFGPSTGLLAALLYASSPLVVIGSRMVQAENGLVPVWLVSLCLLSMAQKFNRPWLLKLAAIVAGIAVLFKLSGVAAIVAGVLIIGKHKGKTEFLAVSLSVAALFVFYGLAIDAKEFLAVFLSNTGRAYGIGLNSVYDLITSTKITSTKYLTDGWPLIGWLSLGYLAIKNRTRGGLSLLISLAVYLSVYLLFGSAPYGWYRIPLLPFLMIAAGYFLSEGITGTNSLLALITLLVPLGVNLTRIFETTTVPWLISAFRFGTFGLIGLALSSTAFPDKRWLSLVVRAAVILLLAVTVVSNLAYAKMINVDYWYKVN